MIFAELDSFFTAIGLSTELVQVGGQTYLVIRSVPIPGGSHCGQQCDVAIRRSDENPWLPEAKIHVRPHLTPMGQNASQPSEVGPDWQYLSRRFDKPPQPRTYYAHILTVLGEL